MVKMCLFQPEFQLKEKFGTPIDGNLTDWKHTWFLYFIKEKAPQSHDSSSYAGVDRCFTSSPQSLNSSYIAKNGALYQKQDLSCP